MTRPITTAPADTASAMRDSEMRGQDMQDAPDRIYRQPGFKAEFVTAIPFERAAIPATTYITEAECQRRIDVAVQAEREACEAEVRRQFRIWEDFGASGFDDLCMAIIPEAIRARGQK